MYFPRLSLAGEFGVMPFSAVYPEVYGDISWIGVRTYKAQIDRFCIRLVEYHCAGHVWRYPPVQILKISGRNLPGSGANFIGGCSRSIGGNVGMDKVGRISGTRLA